MLLSKTVVTAMASAANDAIHKSLLHGSNGMLLPPRTEVGFVAAVTPGAIRDIASAWTPLLVGSGFSLDLSGVFCHGAPMVTFKGTKAQSRRCELADLLIVVDVVTGNTPIRRASLIQAKMANAAERVKLSGRSSIVQLDLYQNWHLFDFEEAAYGMNRVDFNVGKAASDSGTFGVIDRHLKPPVWTQHAVSPTPTRTSNKVRLGGFIAEMVNGGSGFGRLATPSLQTDWSKTVEGLLMVTYARAFHHKATLGPVSAQRGVHAVACLNFATAVNLMQEVEGSLSGVPSLRRR